MFKLRLQTSYQVVYYLWRNCRSEDAAFLFSLLLLQKPFSAVWNVTGLIFKTVYILQCPKELNNVVVLVLEKFVLVQWNVFSNSTTDVLVCLLFTDI